MKIIQCLIVAIALSAAVAHAQGNQPQQSAANGSTETMPNSSVNQGPGRVDRDRMTNKKDDCVCPVSFCQIYFGS